MVIKRCAARVLGLCFGCHGLVSFVGVERLCCCFNLLKSQMVFNKE